MLLHGSVMRQRKERYGDGAGNKAAVDRLLIEEVESPCSLQFTLHFPLDNSPGVNLGGRSSIQKPDADRIGSGCELHIRSLPWPRGFETRLENRFPSGLTVVLECITK
jgi:hypothetical protein